ICCLDIASHQVLLSLPTRRSSDLPLTFNSYRRAKNVLKAFASGWERLQAQNDISLFLSDHVDWNDILYFVGKVKPKAIWTLHGDGRALHAHFSKDIAIRDIHSQTFIPDYC